MLYGGMRESRMFINILYADIHEDFLMSMAGFKTADHCALDRENRL